MSLLDVAIRVTALSLSAILFFVAWCVYENEEKVFQSRIENWWLLFDDLPFSLWVEALLVLLAVKVPVFLVISAAVHRTHLQHRFRPDLHQLADRR